MVIAMGSWGREYISSFSTNEGKKIVPEKIAARHQYYDSFNENAEIASNNVSYSTKDEMMIHDNDTKVIECLTKKRIHRSREISEIDRYSNRYKSVADESGLLSIYERKRCVRSQNTNT